MGVPASVVECGSTHTGGAKSIRLNRLHCARRLAAPIRNLAVLVDISYEDRTYCCTMR